MLKAVPRHGGQYYAMMFVRPKTASFQPFVHSCTAKLITPLPTCRQMKKGFTWVGSAVQHRYSFKGENIYMCAVPRQAKHLGLI